jgi:hypothetical protein
LRQRNRSDASTSPFIIVKLAPSAVVAYAKYVAHRANTIKPHRQTPKRLRTCAP